MSVIQPAAHTGHSRREIRPGKVISKALLYAILISGALLSLLPFLWMISGSMKLDTELYEWPIKWIPDPPRFSNFTDVLEAIPFMTYFFNTLKLAVIITALQLVTCSLAAYAFSKIPFPGRDKMFLMYLGTMMIPFQVTMIPQYIMMGNLGLRNTHTVLILIQAFSPFGVFLLRQAFVGIPRELSEAARIDGCSEMGILVRIILPLSKANLATLTTFTFCYVWNDYLAPMIYLSKDNLRTIQLGIKVFNTVNGVEYTLILAATVMGLAPLILIYLFCQKYFIESAATSGLKG